MRQGNNQIYLKKTTDTRTVLREVLAKHMGYSDVDSMFPSFDATANPEVGLLPTQGRGDVDGNGVVDATDAQEMLSALAGNRSPISPTIGDVNADGSVDLLDALLAAQTGE